VRWSYTRSDRALCTVAAQDGTAMAIYAHDGNCDEVTGLSAATGARSWVRTLFTDGTDIAVTAQPGYVLIAAPGSLDLIEPTGGLDRWFDTPADGCTTRAAVLGSAGVLIDSACRSGDTLSLRPLGATTERAWALPLAGRSVLAADAGGLVLAADHRRVQRLDATDGRVVSSIALGRTIEPTAHPQAGPLANSAVEVVAVTDGLLGFDALGTAVLWQRTAVGIPVDFDRALLIPAAGRLLGIDPTSGRTISTRAAPGVSTASRVMALGTLVLLGGDTTTLLH
jgi:PQQ-like domain